MDERLSEKHLAEHYMQCERIVAYQDEQALLRSLYTTHLCDQGAETDNMRKAILVRLDKLTGNTWKKR